nr:methionyl-tRNA formyltransferase [Melioribacteraceae bacterium]
PDFAVPSLNAILNSKHTISAVVTNTDKEQGRGKKVAFSPIKQFALQQGLKVIQPEKFKDEKFIKELIDINPDVFIVVAFKILPKEVFLIPKYGSFNLHGSLLPKYRGAAPIQWALINGDKETGLTTFFLKETVDTGNIILTKHIEINDDDNFGSLHNKMSIEGANLIIETLEKIENGNLDLKAQEDAHSSSAPKITKETCLLNVNKDAILLHNQVRGLSPVPGSVLEINSKNYKIFKTKALKEPFVEMGNIKTTKNEIFLGCMNSTLQILEIQPEGRRRMLAEEFLRGYKF